MADPAMLRRAGVRVDACAATATIASRAPVMPCITGGCGPHLDQAALDFATWVAIASIKGGERQS